MMRIGIVGCGNIASTLAPVMNHYPEVMKAFSDIGYDGYCIGEMIPTYKHHVVARVYVTSTAMDFILGRR